MESETVPIKTIDITGQLDIRPAREMDPALVRRALLTLTGTMAKNPGDALQSIVNIAADLTSAQTAGVSVLEQTHTGKRFKWHAVTGQWSKYLGGSMPREASPCGTILDRNDHMLMYKPHLHYEAMRIADPPIEEVILTPFYDGGTTPIGTLWIISHDRTLKFDSTDIAMLKELAAFTSGAYRTLKSLGYVND